MVGDGLEKDVLGASAVGIRSVLLCRNPDHQPEWGGPAIQDLTEILPFLGMA
jgi:FMN phosphatase YigB (HAD superfamily)